MSREAVVIPDLAEYASNASHGKIRKAECGKQKAETEKRLRVRKFTQMASQSSTLKPRPIPAESSVGNSPS